MDEALGMTPRHHPEFFSIGSVQVVRTRYLPCTGTVVLPEVYPQGCEVAVMNNAQVALT